MENVEKISIEPTTATAVMALLALAISDDVQALGLDSILANCHFFMLKGGEGVEFAYALKPCGRELWIQAAGGRGKIDLTETGLRAVEIQAAGAFSSVGFQTRRRGLVKKAKKAGYVVDGWILRKKIND